MALLAMVFGVILILPIGGADMPTVISLLNSYAGLAAAAMGFVLDNKLLIIAGSLDGSSGLILSIIMCRAMNRSFTNVLFGAFGQVQAQETAQAEKRTVRSATAEEAAAILDAASSVMIVPGYGMAVAQAQHKVRELTDLLTKRGVNVRFAIHPVAGRMPGHMNVLLAEADVPYDKLLEMEDANPELPQTDVALVIGANDVTNPAARHDKASPVYGMPILDVDKAHTVMVIKRGMSPGFAGIDNELYYMDRTLMLFGDAKAFVGSLVKELSSRPDGRPVGVVVDATRASWLNLFGPLESSRRKLHVCRERTAHRPGHQRPVARGRRLPGEARPGGGHGHARDAGDLRRHPRGRRGLPVAAVQDDRASFGGGRGRQSSASTT